jgi:phage terminase small subunit
VRRDAAFEGRVRAELEARGAWSDTLIPAVERYARAVALARKAWTKVPDHLTAVGSTGQIVAHPLIATALNAEKAAADFGEHLGLSLPKEARKPGRPKSADRTADVRPGPTKLRVAG